jgi:hypothetical protein
VYPLGNLWGGGALLGTYGIGEFFNLLWPTPQAHIADAGLTICSSSQTRAAAERFKYRGRLPTADHPALIAECGKWAARGEDVYLGIGATKTTARFRGTANDVVAIPAFWAELDVNGPAHKRPTGVPSMEAAFEFVQGVGLPPSFTVSSGHGLHVYWLFENPWLLPNEAERQRAAALFTRFGETLRDKGARLGYQLDPVWELARVLRVPDTYNFKNGDRVPVVLNASHDNDTYCESHFQQWISDASKLYVQAPRGTIEVVEAPGFDAAPVDELAFTVPPVGEALAKGATWAPALEPLIKRLRLIARGQVRAKPGSAILAQKMLDREPLAGLGERDNATNAAAGILAFAAKYMPLTLDDLMQVLWGSVENMPGGLDDPPPSRQNTLKKLKGAMEDAAKEVAAEKAQNAAIEEGLVRQGRERRQQERAGVTSLAEYRRAKRHEESGGDPTGYYTPDDIERFAHENDATVEEWEHRWIIAANKRYYIWTEDRYVAWPAMHVAVTIERELRPAGLELTKRNKKGEITGLISVDEMVRRYGTTAIGVEINLAAKKTTFDAARQMIIDAPCPLKAFKPTFHPLIDEWLRAIGGPKADKVLDWVATAAELEVPSSALYLDGTASAGKSMLALGLARLWGTSPASFAQVFGSNFNGDLARCPLVFADEALPDNREKDITAVLRDAVSQEERTINRKYQEEMTMRGAVRVVIAGNNPNLIIKSAKGLSGADLDAYVARFLHIKVGPAAAELLHRWGGRKTTHDWVTGNKIAEHALWLAAHRKVPMGKRFRVDGEETSMHRAIVSKGSAKVLEWQSQYVSQKRPPHESVMLMGEGLLLVSTSGLAANWSEVPTNDVAPSLSAIGAALKAVAYEQPIALKRNGKEVRYRVMDPSHLLDFMREVDGDVEGLKARLAAPLPDWLQEDLQGRVKVEKHPWLAQWLARTTV